MSRVWRPGGTTALGAGGAVQGLGLVCDRLRPQDWRSIGVQCIVRQEQRRKFSCEGDGKDRKIRLEEIRQETRKEIAGPDSSIQPALTLRGAASPTCCGKSNHEGQLAPSSASFRRSCSRLSPLF